MTRWFPCPLRTLQTRHAAVRALGILALLLLAAAAPAAPEYALSGQAPALEKSVLAQTPGGPVTALDVLMLDAMRDQAVGTIPMTAWLNPGALESTPYRPAMKTAVERLLAYRALAARAGGWEPAEDVLRVKSFGAAAAVWIESAVKPEVRVMPSDIDRYYLAHPEKYLRRLSAQVRYIFMAANMTDPGDKQRVREKLEAVARDIQDGKITFEEAARRSSEAPSGAQGGLLPPFYNGAFFPEFDRQTFQLDKPGKVSPVFEGPEGYYMVQLVRTWPPQNIPIGKVHEEIRSNLTLEHVRHYHAYLLAKLMERYYVQNLASQWNYLNLETPIVMINNLKLTRTDFLRYFGNPVGANFETRLYEIVAGSTAWIEGEITMNELARLGQAQHPWIQRARELAALPLKTDQYYMTQIPAETYSPSQAIQTIKTSKQFIQGLRSAHVVQIQVQIKKQKERSQGGLLGGALAVPGARGGSSQANTEATALQNSIAAQIASGVLPTEPTPINLSQWVQKNAAGGTGQLLSALGDLQQQLDDTPWPGVGVTVKDLDWVDAVPGTPWYEALKNVGVGQVSQPATLATGTTLYLVIAERPLDLTQWETKPLMVRALAFQIEASKLFAAEVLRVRQSGGVTYTFQ